MSFSEQIVFAFNKLLNEKPSLFSKDELDELTKQVASLEDDTEKLSEFISGWSKKHPKIRDTLFKVFISENNDNIIRTIPYDDGTFSPPPPPTKKSRKDTLINSLKKASENISGNESSKAEK